MSPIDWIIVAGALVGLLVIGLVTKKRDNTVDRWRAAHGRAVRDWLEALGEWEARSSSTPIRGSGDPEPGHGRSGAEFTTVSGVPVEIIQEFDTWRKIRDVEGTVGFADLEGDFAVAFAGLFGAV